MTPRLNILVLGVSGLIGSAISARLNVAGHSVIGLSRRLPAASMNLSTSIAADIACMKTERDWLPLLKNVDAIVNCAGILQDAPRDSTRAVHAESIGALFRSAKTAGIRKVIHLSAIGVDREAPTPFSKSKLQGDEILMSLDLDWVILRPSVVVGRPAYGGSALFRGLAALPVFPKPPHTGPLQLVQLEDLVETVIFFLDEKAPAKIALDVAGPEQLSVISIVAAYRHWLGQKPAAVVHLPPWLAQIMYRAGDLASLLGWRPPMRSTAAAEIRRGAVGDNSKWINTTGISPRSLLSALSAEPASIQEKWFSRLYFLKALVLVIFALFWITTGVISFGPGWGIGMDLMREGGVEKIGPMLIAAGATSDILIGVGILFRPTTHIALSAALGISIAYVIIGTILVPRLWTDPLGPMLKIWPIIVFNLVAIAILDDR